MIIWTLTFTLKGFMFGPVANANIIRTATANTYDSTFNLSGTREFTLDGSTGNGIFKFGELIYEGKTLASANATAFVESWTPSSNTLLVVDTNGVFNTGKYIFGAVSNAAYNLVSSAEVAGQLNNIVITPDPLSANVSTAFGFDTTIEEAPNIT
jgi:hypothetical protein